MRSITILGHDDTAFPGYSAPLFRIRAAELLRRIHCGGGRLDLRDARHGSPALYAHPRGA